MKFFRKSAEYLFYLFVFLLPWQSKLILRPSVTNFNEISLYASHLILLLVLICFFVHKIKHRERAEKITYFWYFLIGLELFILFSFFFAADQILAFYRYILFLVGLGLFYLLQEGFRKNVYEDCCLNKINIVYSFLASVFLQALLGIYQFLTQSSFACKYLGLAAHYPDSLGASIIETVSGRWLRAYGGLDHPNIFGGVLAVSLVIVAYLLAKKKMLNSSQEVWSSIFLFIFYFFALFALFFTFSRAAWLALVVGLVILLIQLIVNKDRWMLGRYIALLFFSLVLISIVSFSYSDLITTRWHMDSRLEVKSLTERQAYLDQAKDLIKDNWLFGVGPGNYTVALMTQNKITSSIWDYQPVHNVFLLLWSESGIFALLFFVLFLIFLIKKDRREAFSWAIFGVLIILMLFDHWLWSLPFGFLFLFLFLGLI